MNKLQLFLLLRRNTKLSERRNVMFEANQYGRLFGYIMVSFVAVELIAIGTFLGWMSVKEDIEQLIFFIMPFLMIFDFGARFMTQQTPMMLVKPYLLTPISKYSAIDCFLIQQMLDGGNLIWMTLFGPYVFIVLCGGVSWAGAFLMLCLLHLMVLVNSQWYLLVRTLVNRHLLWWIVPAVFYAALILPFIVLSDHMVDRYADILLAAMERYAFSVWAFALYAVMLATLFIINRSLQMHFVYDEITRNEKTKLKHVSEFTLLNRFGQIGEYLKLEIKSTMRNKAIRTRFIQGICLITFFSLMITFGNVYNSSFERNFWCLYAFIYFGTVNLVKVMCPEGNFIDLLMVHEENILTLLRAKYYYYCTILLLPVILVLPPVLIGKFPFLMVLAYLLTATGPVYCMLFQMAVYNKQTLPLNDKITGKNQAENKWQAIVSMTGFFAPVAVVMLLQAIFDSQTAYWVLIVVGLAFTLTESVWMRHIYNRMMRRRYQNLEGFHSSR